MSDEIEQGPDWYCNYCDKMVPHVESRNGRHDEAKGGCGNALSSCKLDKGAIPVDWKTP